MGEKVLLSELAGIISRIMVSEGDTVAAGETLLTVEAMKMETSIVSPVHMIINELSVQSQDLINKNEPLLTYTPVSEASGHSEY